MWRQLLVVTLASAVGTAVARAQGVSEVEAGSRVRVWSSELPRRGLTVQLRSWTADSLRVDGPPRRRSRPPEQWTISTRSVSRLDVEVPRTRGEGARTFGLLGAASGVGSGVMLGLAAAALGGQYYPRGTDRPGVHPLYFSVPVSVAIGGVIGASGGALFPGKRWRRVVPPAR